MDVHVLRWPASENQLASLRAEGVPRLLVVDGDVSPPVPFDDLEDWVRLPADQADVRLRADTLARRARARQVPALTPEGLLRFQGQVVTFSPVEAALVAVLVARFESVVSRRDLTQAAWPGSAPDRNALDVHISRVRRRLDTTNLRVSTVRGRGYMLTDSSDSVQELAVNE
jgi:DNA-binding response OmpR family regulator